MKIKIFLLALGLLFTSSASVLGYKAFNENFEIKPKKEVLGEKQAEINPEPTLTLTPSPSPTPTTEPKRILPTQLPTFSPTPSPTPLPSNNNQQLNNGQSRSDNTLGNGGYEDWSATQPKDSRGVLCTNPDSRCKYECSVGDFYVDDQLRILNNHLQESLSCKKIKTDCHIWEDAVMNVYNMIYEECKNSPKYNPQNPL